jgi:diketogulonate reductase-like aldo/keto reductase
MFPMFALLTVHSPLATKIASRHHGYESTLKGVDASLERMKLGSSPISSELYLSIFTYDSDYVDLFLIHDPLVWKTASFRDIQGSTGSKGSRKDKICWRVELVSFLSLNS